MCIKIIRQPIDQLENLLKTKKSITRKEANNLVGSHLTTALIQSLIKKWHKIVTIRDFDEVHGYDYRWYTPPFYLVARDIQYKHPVLEKIVRVLYYLVK